MKLRLERYRQTDVATAGRIIMPDKSIYHTLEDEKREVKIAGKTRINALTYDIKPRRVGSMHKRYLKRFGHGNHRGMLWLQKVPNFKWIYIHPGLTHRHTQGCVLVGPSINLDTMELAWDEYRAYQEFYAAVIDYAIAGDLQIEIVEKFGWLDEKSA